MTQTAAVNYKTSVVEPNALRVSNTLGSSVARFEPLDATVRLFVCGPTVYDYAHLGHAKTYTQFDFIARVLRWLGYTVVYLQNITDIDDKIIQRAAERGVDWRELTAEYEQAYYEDMRALRNTAVDTHARATDYIPQIVEQVQALLRRGHAYYTSDGVYFDLKTFPRYGKLSGRTALRADDAVSRIDDGVQKRNWNDFCLWKAAKAGEPIWNTPLGPGRPGWHIEDTAITESQLGPQYDIHGGAIDLIFPHHEAEIAQMEAITGVEPLAKYWLHTGFLNINNEKMAKSKSNFKTIRGVLEVHDYRTLRYFFLSQHYKTTINFTADSLEHARQGLDRIHEFVFRIEKDVDDAAIAARVARLRADIRAALCDDFHTPRLLASLFGFITEAYAEHYPLGRGVYGLFAELDTLFDCLDSADVSGIGISDDNVRALMRVRDELRRARDFRGADAIRDHLVAHGIQIYDGVGGLRWRRV